MSSPYEQYKSHPFWKIVEEAIFELTANNDLIEVTGHDHVVGFIVKRLVDNSQRLPADLVQMIGRTLPDTTKPKKDDYHC